MARPAWKFCKRCGARMEGTNGKPAPVAGRPSRHPWEPSPGEGRRPPVAPLCPRCRAALRAGALFCDACGTALGETDTKTQGGTTAPVLPGREPRPAELAPVEAPVPRASTFGGYAEELQVPEAESLSAAASRSFKRLLTGVVIMLVIICLATVFRLWRPRPPSSQRGDRPAAAGSAPEKKPETARLFPADFSVGAVENEGESVGGHPPVIVRLGEQALFMIRDEGEYASPLDRAKAVTDNLRRTMTNLQRDPAAEFRIAGRPEGPTIVQAVPDVAGEKELPVVSVTSHDVKGYVRRSRRGVTAGQLAEWWLNRLKDRVNLFVKGIAPRLTVADEDGRLLAELYDRAEKESLGGRPSREALHQALLTLSPEQRRLLSYEGVRAFPNQTGDRSQ